MDRDQAVLEMEHLNLMEADLAAKKLDIVIEPCKMLTVVTSEFGAWLKQEYPRIYLSFLIALLAADYKVNAIGGLVICGVHGIQMERLELLQKAGITVYTSIYSSVANRGLL